MSQVCVYAYSDSFGVRKYADETDLNFTGTWSAYGSYTAEQDVATYSDAQYIAIISNVGANPRAATTRTRPAKWSPLALLYEHQCDGAGVAANGQSMLLAMGSAFTPAGAGPDGNQVVVPHGLDGSQSVTWTIKRATLRVASAGSAASVAIEKSAGNGVFNGTQITVLSLGSNTYETSNAGILGTVSSGDKMRMNVLDAGSAQNWSVSVQLYRAT